MLTDPLDQHLAAVLKAARPAPPPGWRSQALAAMSVVRPRRHPNLVTIIVVTLILLALAAGAYAAARFLLEGTLQVGSAVSSSGQAAAGHYFEVATRVYRDGLEWHTVEPSMPRYLARRRISPDGKTQAFDRWGEPGVPWPPQELDIHRANPDGSQEVNLTRKAGLGGVNCHPVWSPDGSVIAFAHVDLGTYKWPCYARFQLWLMNADGSAARRLTPQGSPCCNAWGAQWSPDGSSIRSNWEDLVTGMATEAFTVDVQTGRLQALPNVGVSAVWSPDGSRIASICYEPGTVRGKVGWWNKLVLTNADGSHPRVLVQQFIADADVVARYCQGIGKPPDDYDRLADVRRYAGPSFPAWSPSGKQIAFLAALPYDPDGANYKCQIEVWVYDLKTDELARITHDDLWQTGVRWK
jgi:hypothetical protein